jgi:FkbM family methyltransferase
LLNPRTIEPEIVALFCAIDDLFQPTVFWDVGANNGYYGWLLKSRHRSMSIVMVEPDPDNAAMLRDTITRRAIPGITVLQAAVSDQPGSGLFALDRVSGATGSLASSGQRFNETHYGAASQVIPVETVRLDDLGTPQARPDFVKIDVEGHEHAGARRCGSAHRA